MGLWSQLCCCGSTKDEKPEPNNVSPAEKEGSPRRPSIIATEDIPKEKKVPVDEPSVVPGISDPAKTKAPEEDFGNHLIITDDTIDRQLKRLATNASYRSKTEEDRWFEST